MTEVNYSKTWTRLAAVQVLYAIAIQEHENFEEKLQGALKDIIKFYENLNLEDFFDEEAQNISYKKESSQINTKFLYKICFEVFNNISTIDDYIRKYLHKEQSIDRLSLLVKSILRCGVCELLYFATPYKVTIDEYVKLSKDFLSASEVNFINALLDVVSKKHKQDNEENTNE